MDIGFQSLLDSFVELGGVAENISQTKGDFGRGIFSTDPSRRSKILSPENLLVDRDNIIISSDEIRIKDKSYYSAKECSFLEIYYNNYSWGNSGNIDSANFLKFLESCSEPVTKLLLDCGFINQKFLDVYDSADRLLIRFIDERVVGFRNRVVLAPVWEFVNHSSFMPQLRVTSYGVETPPIAPTTKEILFKYSGKNSPLSMWKKYGFACRCIVTYSIPFRISIGSGYTFVSCSGQQGLPSTEKRSFSVTSDSLVIKSLPVGCLSTGLPFATFKSTLCSAGVSVEVAKRLFWKVREINIKARHDLLSALRNSGMISQSELYKALMYEIELIEGSSIQ